MRHKIFGMTRLPLPAFFFLLIFQLTSLAQTTFIQKSASFHTSSEFQQMTSSRVELRRSVRLERKDDLLVGSRSGIVRRLSDGSFAPFPAKGVLPAREITVISSDPQGVVWIGTTRGVIRFEESANRVEYFAGQRWLPSDAVSGIGFETINNSRAVWIATSRGLSRILFEPMTFEEKARRFEERIRTRHVRHGLTASSHLTRAGDLSSNRTVSTDNDGLWTAMYVAAECFRYAVTKSAEARANARRGMEAILRLEEITGIRGFPARSFIKVGEDEQPKDGEWHMTPDGKWSWKGDTSSDEIVGHYFVYPIYLDLVASDEEKIRIKGVVERITSHIIDNKFQLIDVDGKRTRWGWWGPDEIWKDVDETGLRALHLLSHLRVAIYITHNPEFERVYRDLITTHRYHLLMRNQKITIPGKVNHSDDELAFLSFYPLLHYEKDPALLEVYREGLTRSWQVERPERNPLWNFIYAAGTGEKDYDREESIRTLREIPMDLVSWTMTNSHREDVPRDSAADRFSRAQAMVVLPYDELPIMKWNGNPYRMDGGDGGRSEDDGAYFLLPYWMGRFHKLIDE
jgi:hypothetical protein